MSEWKVNVIEKATKEVVEVIDCDCESSAKEVKQGMMINMNHADYRVEIEEVK
jgi:hypothetical protein